MAQQVFTQWVPVAKAQNEQGQEVYLPFAGIHAQTRDGKDEVIVGAGNMVWTGSMWVPVSAQNRLPVEATLTGHTVDMATETTLAQAVDKLNSILSRLEGKLDTAIFDSQGNPISAANRLPVEATLSGRKVSRVQPAPLTTTPLGANATYTQPWQDAETWQGAGGTGALVVSGIAKADKPGTLFLDVSYDGRDFIVWDTALANSTGVARLRPTTIPLRYFRFRYRNGDEAQNSFVLVQNVMQEGDGRGAEHGMGADRFSRTGPMAAGTVELIADLRSAVQIMSIQLVSRTPQAAIRISGYKDDGSVAPVNYATFSSAAMLDHRISSVYSFGHSWFEVTRWEDQDAQYVMWTRPGAPLLFPRGVQIYVANNDSAEYNVHCHVYVRLL